MMPTVGIVGESPLSTKLHHVDTDRNIYNISDLQRTFDFIMMFEVYHEYVLHQSKKNKLYRYSLNLF